MLMTTCISVASGMHGFYFTLSHLDCDPFRCISSELSVGILTKSPAGCWKELTMTYKNLFYYAAGLFSLLYTSVVAADVLDGGEIRFHGEVTDEGPRWTWQLATSDQTWAVDTADAKTLSGHLVFDFSTKGMLPFLEGRLHEVADQGGPGFSPLVNFSSLGQPFLLPDGGNTTQGRFKAAVPVTDAETGKSVGQLTFMVEQGLAATFGDQSVSHGSSAVGSISPGMVLLVGDAVNHLPAGGLSQGMISRLSSLLRMTPGWERGMSATFNGQVMPQELLSSSRVTNIAAAYASVLSGFQLMLPADNTPAHWQARLSVTVTVQ